MTTFSTKSEFITHIAGEMFIAIARTIGVPETVMPAIERFYRNSDITVLEWDLEAFVPAMHHLVCALASRIPFIYGIDTNAPAAIGDEPIETLTRLTGYLEGVMDATLALSD